MPKIPEGRELHACYAQEMTWALYGPAITECREDSRGRLWVDGVHQIAASSFYLATQVNFCPFCGAKAKTAVKPNPKCKDAYDINLEYVPHWETRGAKVE